MNVKELSNAELVVLWHRTNYSPNGFHDSYGELYSFTRSLDRIFSVNLWISLDQEVERRGICPETGTYVDTGELIEYELPTRESLYE